MSGIWISIPPGQLRYQNILGAIRQIDELPEHVVSRLPERVDDLVDDFDTGEGDGDGMSQVAATADPVVDGIGYQRSLKILQSFLCFWTRLRKKMRSTLLRHSLT